MEVGDTVVLIGAQGEERILAEEVARRLGTINYEVTCGLSAAGGPAARAGERPADRRPRRTRPPGLWAGPFATSCSAGRWPTWTWRWPAIPRPRRVPWPACSAAPCSRCPSGSAPGGRSTATPACSYDVSALQGETIEADLSRRDFSVNAMARPVAGGSVIDPEGGRADLDARVLQGPLGDAYEADPLRALRLARLAAELEFTPDAETETLTRAAAPRVTEASAERLFGELRRLIVARGALAGRRRWPTGWGCWRAVLPELHDLHDVEQSGYHHLDVYGHTIEVLAHQIELEERLDEVFGELAPRAARGARGAAGGRAHARRRRSGSARSSTTWASRPRAACARTAG